MSHDFQSASVRYTERRKESNFMNIKVSVLLFIAGAAMSWGLYVPVVHKATAALGSNLRAFLMVGIAYFLVAVVVPCVFIFVLKNDPTASGKIAPNFQLTSMVWGVLAGVAGAVGALCVIFAVKTAGPGAAIYVAPLVFAGAPIINTFVSMTFFSHGATEKPGPLFFGGLILAASGAAMVMLFKPKPVAAAPAPIPVIEPAEAPPVNDTGTQE